MKEYDILVYFDADYLCTGGFYDSFEYFWLLRTKGYNVGLVIVVDEGHGTVIKAIKAKYRVKLAGAIDNIHIFSRQMLYANDPKYTHFPAKTNILFIPSMAAACCMYNNKVNIKHNRMITIAELPIEHSWMKAFDKPRPNVLILRDQRIFEAFEGYENGEYHRALYFDIMKPAKKIDWAYATGMLNMVTDHKCYSPKEINEIISGKDFEHIKNWVLFTKDKHWKKYSSMARPGFDVIKTPDDDYINRFSHILYLPSKRSFDPSPRLIPEAKFYEKEFIYHDFMNAPMDGGKFRFMDTVNAWRSMSLTLDNIIFDIIEDYRCK